MQWLIAKINKNEQADAKGRGCIDSYEVGDQVLLNAKNLPTNVVSAVVNTKLSPRFIGPFTVTAKKGLAYTLNLPRKLRTHPSFYVGVLKPNHDPSHVDWKALAPEEGTSSPLAVSSSRAPPGHPAMQVVLHLLQSFLDRVDRSETIHQLTQLSQLSR